MSRFLTALVFCLSVSGAAAAQDLQTIGHTDPGLGTSTVYGFGAQLCSTWVASAKDNEELAVAQSSWVMGFVSGAESVESYTQFFLAMADSQKPEAERLHTKLAIFSITSKEAMDKWMSAYCQQHQTERISTAALMLFYKIAGS